MNRSLVLIRITLLLVLSSSIVFAQKFTWGIKAGGTLSLTTFADEDDKDEFTPREKIGFAVTGLLNYPFKNNYSLQSEIGFSQRGRRIKFNSDSSTHTASYQFLDFGLLVRKSFRVQWGEHIPGHWFVNAGPRLSYWLGGKGNVTGTHPFDYTVVLGPLSEVPLIEPDKMYLKGTNRWMAGFDIGLGIDAPIRKIHDLVLELRYSQGFTQYGNKNSVYTSQPGFSDSLKATEKIISLSIGYTIEYNIKAPRKGKSTKQDRKRTKPRKEIDSLLH
ncbi:MAG: porin family protein [Cyclobacteriaceae bacterium]